MKYKKYIIFITIISLIFYCRHQVLNHDIPIANIEFVKIEENIKYENSFYLYFTSDIELTDNLRKEHVNGGITCFFLNKSISKNDFSNDKGFILSSVSDIELKSKTTKYNYVVKTFFKTKIYDNNLSSADRKNIVLKEVSNLLNKEPNCISCVATSVGYMGMPKRYISNTMYIPKENIKKIME